MKHLVLGMPLLAVGLFINSSASAASTTWAGGSGTQAWATPGNWSPAGAPGATSGTTTSPDVATFNTATAGTSVTIDSGRNVSGIVFDGAAGAFTIGSAGANQGNSLLLSSGGSVTLGVSATSFTGTGMTETINAPLVLEGATTTTAGNYSFTNNSTDSTNTLSFGGNISSATSSTMALALSGANTGANTIAGVIANGAGAGALSLSKTGAGTWILSGNNTYTGATSVANGSLFVNGTTSGQGNYNYTGMTAGSTFLQASPSSAGTYSTVGGSLLGGQGTIGTSGLIITGLGNTLLAHLAPGLPNATAVSNAPNDFGASSIGTLTVNGPVILGTNSSLDIYYDSQNLPQVSKLSVAGTFSIAGNTATPAYLSLNALTSDEGWASDTNFGSPLTFVSSTGAMSVGNGFANAYIASGQTVSNELIYGGGGTQDFYVTYNTSGKQITLTPFDNNNTISNFTQNTGTVNDTWSQAGGSGAGNWNNGNGAFNLVSNSGTVVAFEGGQTLASGAAITSTNDIATGATVSQTAAGAPFSRSNVFLLNSLDLNGTGPASGTATVTVNGNALDFSTGTNAATNQVNSAPTIFLSGIGSSLTETLANDLILSSTTTVAGSGTANFKFSGAIVGPGTLNFVPGYSGTDLTLSGANSTYADVGGISTGPSSTLKFGSNFYSMGSFSPGASSTLDVQGNTVAFASITDPSNTGVTLQSTGGPGYFDENYVGSTADSATGVSIGSNMVFQNNASGSVTEGPTGAVNAGGVANFGSGLLTINNSPSTAVVAGLFGAIKDSQVVTPSGNVLLNGGTFWLQLNTAGMTQQSAVGSQLLYGGGGVLELDGGAGQLIFDYAGNASDTAPVFAPAAGSAGTLVLAPANGSAALGVQVGSTEEKLTVLGTASALPTNTDGIVSPTIFVANNDANQTGDFVSYTSGSGFVSATTATASHSGTATGYSATGANSLTGATTASTVDVSSNQTVSNSTTGAYSMRVGASDTVTISGGNTLTIGNGTGPAGLILNGGTIAGGSSNTLAFRGSEPVIYTSLANGTIGTNFTDTNSSFGLVKTGAGTLFLTGGASSLTGAVVLDNGALDVGAMSAGNLPATQLDLYGGVIQGNGLFSRNLATGTAANGTVSVGGLAGASLGGGGFAAKGGTLVVDLNGGTGTVTWGASGSDFLQDTTTGEQSSQALVFGSNSSDSQVNFQNGIALGATNPSYYREIYVSSGTGTDSALISGTISDTAGSVGGHGLLKDGSGSLILSGNNSYAGLTQVSNGSLFVNGTTSGQGSYTVAPVTSTGNLSIVNNTGVQGTPSFNSYANVNGNTTVNGQKTTNGALLGGVGTINLAANQTLNLTGASATDTAHFAPGVASSVGVPTTGMLTVGTAGNNNSVTLGTNSSFDVYLDGNNAQPSNQLAVNGTLNLNSTSGALSINEVTGDTGWNTKIYGGEVFNIINATSITGAFSNAANLSVVQTQNTATGALNLLASYNTATPGSASVNNFTLTNLGTQYFTGTTTVSDNWSGANTTGKANWNSGNGTGIAGGLASGPSSAITFDAGKTFGSGAAITSTNDIATGLTVSSVGSSNTNVFQLNYLNLGGTSTNGTGDQVTISGHALEFVTDTLNGNVAPTVYLDSIGQNEGADQITYTITNNIILNNDTTFTTADATSRSLSLPGGEDMFTGAFSGTGALIYSPQDTVSLGYNLTLGSDTTANTHANTGYAYQGNIMVNGGTLYIAEGTNTTFTIPAVQNDFYTTGSLNVAAGATVNVGTSTVAVSGLTGTGTITGNGASGQGGISINDVSPITDVFGGTMVAVGTGFVNQGVDRFNGAGDFTFSNPLALSVGSGGGGSSPGTFYVNGTGVVTLTGPYAGPGIMGFGLGSTKITASNTSTTAPALGIAAGTTFNSGTLWIQPTGTGGNVSVVAEAGSNPINFHGGGTIKLDRGANSSVTLSTYYGAGAGVNGLAISTAVGQNGAFDGIGAGALVLTDPHGASALGTTDHFVLTGGANDNSYLLAGGSNVTKSVTTIADSDANATGDFATYIGSTGTTADAGFESAMTAGLYTGHTNNLASSNSASIEYVNTTGQTISANTSVSALRIDGTDSTSTPNVTINSGDTLTLSNNLILNGGTITGAGTLSSGVVLGVYTSLLNGTISAVYSNPINNANLVKYGPGTLYLTNTANFNGMGGNQGISLDGGALDVGAMSGGTTSSNSGGLPSADLAFQGGVLQGHGSFTRSIGTVASGNSQIVNFQDGGFAGDSASTPFTITLGGGLGTGGSLVWGQALSSNPANDPANTTGGTPTGFLGDSATLMFGSNTSSGLVNFANNLDLGAESSTYWRDIFVTAGGSPAGTPTGSATKIGTDSALISGTITDTAGGTSLGSNVEVAGDHGLLKDGDGSLILSANNTYSGFTDVSNGALFVTGTTSNQGNYTVTPITNTTAGVAVSSVSGTNATYVHFNPVTGNYDTVNGSLLGGNGSIGLALNQTLALNGTTTVQAGTNTSTTGVYSDVVAHLAPGVTTSVGLENIGSLTVGTVGNNNTVSFGANSALDIYMSATASGSAASELIVNGNLGLNGAAQLNFSLEQAATGFSTGDVLASPYTIAAFTPGDLTGTFAGEANGSSVISDGINFVLNYNNAAGTITLTPQAAASAYYNGTSSNLNVIGSFDTDVSSGTPNAAAEATTNVFFSANRNTATATTITAPLVVNSVNFGTGTGTNSGMTISSANNNPANNLTINASNLNGNGNNGISITGGGTDTINAPVVLGASQTWTPDSGANLIVNGQVSGTGFSMTKAGLGTVVLSNANTYSGGTTVSSGTLELNNGTNGSATGSGALNVGTGAILAGIGSSHGSSFNVTGTSNSAVATVLVGHNSASDINTSGVMSLQATGASSIGAANLVFNLSATSAGVGNQLSVGATAIAFNAVSSMNTTLTLNLQGSHIIASGTTYVLVAGTTASGGSGQLGSQYTGLDLGTSTSLGSGITETKILNSDFGGTGSLSLSFGNFNSFYGSNSFLFLYQNANTGVDDIEVDVVPEPGTWALMLGGLAVLLVLQKVRRKQEINS